MLKGGAFLVTTVVPLPQTVQSNEDSIKPSLTFSISNNSNSTLALYLSIISSTGQSKRGSYKPVHVSKSYLVTVVNFAKSNY